MTGNEIERAPSPTAHWTAFLLVSIVVAVVTGASVAKTEIVAKGQGRAVPASRVQTVQAQTAGRIERIVVKDGDVVEKDQPLVVLNTTESETRLAALRLSHGRELAREAAALATIKALRGPPQDALEPALADFDARTSGQGGTELQRDLLRTTLQTLADGLDRVDADEARSAKAIDTAEAQVASLEAQKELAAARVERAGALAEKGAGTQVAADEAVSAAGTLDAQIVVAQRAREERETESGMLAVERQRLINDVRRTSAETLEAAQAARLKLEEDIRASEQDLKDRTIRAPRAGRVTDLAVFTVGGRVGDGEKLMTIVPSGERITVEALVSNRDIGLVDEGQRTFLKFDAFPFERYGILRGTVERVASDARKEEAAGGAYVYPIEVVLDRPYVEVAGRTLAIQPGMTGQVDIVTGERRYISYFFEPITKVIEESFSEP